MSASGEALVKAAQSWIGTPYVHQAATKGAGCDCLGLIRGLWCDRFGAEPETVPPYSMDWSEPQGEEQLWAGALRHMAVKDRDHAAQGDVLLFRMRQGAVAKHLGLQTRIDDSPSFIHAYSGHGVVESPLSVPWQRRIVARFIFPEEIF